MKQILLLGAAALICFGAVKDSDLDGVPDNLDKCPNTPFLETVNKYGCSTTQLKKLKKKNIKFNLNIGYEYDRYKSYNDSKIIFTSISAKKNSIKTSIFYSIKDDSNGYKSNDLIWSIYYYNSSTKNTSIKAGVKMYLPTNYNKKTDYAFVIKGSYYFKKFNISLSEKHKIYGETGTNPKDTITLNIGTFYKKLYVSPYVYTENSAYNSSKWYKYAGLTLFYPITNKIGITIDSSFDMEESQNYTLTGSLGYSF